MPMQGRMRPHQRLHARALRLRESVIARLLLTLVLALGAVGTFQYVVVGQRVEHDLIREHAAVHAADARSLEQRAEEAEGNRYESPLSEVTEVLAAIAERPDTIDVAVLEADGTVLVSPIAGQVGVLRTDPLVKKVARTHRPVTGVPASDGRNAYITPMQLLGRDVLFAEYRDAEALRAGVASFRDSLGLFVLLSLLIALPLFYVLGGRSVGVLYRAALQRARRDGLTDLDNHRAFQDELARAVGEASRYGSTVTLALLDIDDFKFENDRHGHQHGDRLLCELAELLREQRAGDRAFRLGGDEFARPARAHERGRRRHPARAHPHGGRAAPLGRHHQHRLQRRARRRPRAELAVGPRRRRPARGQAPRRQRDRRLHRGRRQRPGRDDREGPRRALADRRRRGRRRVPADLGPRRHARARLRGARAPALGGAVRARRGVRDRRLDRPRPRARRRLPPRDAARRRRAAQGRPAVPQRVAADARARRARRRQPRARRARRRLRARAGRARDHRAHRRAQGAAAPRGGAAALARLQARARRRRRRQRRASRCCARCPSTSSRSTARWSPTRSRTAAPAR